MLRKNDNLKVTFYKNSRSRLGIDIDLIEALSDVTYKNEIEKIRSCEYHSDEYDALKLELPIFSAHATYKYGKAKTNANANPNGLICIDIDYQDNTELINKIGIDELKYQLLNQSSVVAVATSCGGRGIMVFHRLDDKVTRDNFINYYNEFKYLYTQGGIVIDEKCGDVARKRYISYDENILINEIYEPYSLRGIKIVESDNNEVKNVINTNNTYHNWIVNPNFDIDNYVIDNNKDIEGFYALRRKWLATTVKRFFGDKGLQLAIDIYKAYPNTVVKQDSVEEIKRNWTYKPACITSIANDLVKLGILKVNDNNDDHHFNLKDDEYLSDVIGKIKFNVGFNLLVAGTGYGKTEVWKKLADISDVTGKSINNVLVCEPRNSIIMSKYIDEQYEQVYGSKQFPTLPNGLVVTNYDKLITNNICRNYDWFSNFDYFVIDESHLLFSEAYRDHSIIKFIELLMNISDKTRIIFQTATPTDEDDMFNIGENIFYVNKNIDKQTSIEYIDCYGDLLYNAEVIAKDALDTKQCDKVFIYNGTGSVVSDEALKENMLGNYNVLVYHRKSQYKDVMELFDEQHMMSINDGFKITDYDVFISSTAASVGIDINDDCNVLVIIIGNISFEEEMQVAGRFRKCKNMSIKCLIGNGQYNTDNWYNIRSGVFETLDNISYNNENYDSNVISKQTLYGINVGNVKDYNTKKLKYFQIKNIKLRTSYNYKIAKYEEYGWTYNERIINKNIFEIMKYVDGFVLGETTFKFVDSKNDCNYRELIVDNNKVYRLYGDKENGWILCRRYYDDNYVERARAYRKNISEKSKHIKEKLLNIIKEGNWKDDYYKYKNEFTLIAGWIDDIVRCYKYHKKLFNICDDDTLLNNNRLLYILMRFIDFSQREKYDWVEWFIIKLCRQNRIDDMAGYAYLVWCLYSIDNDKNKLMKISYYDSFKTLFNLLVYEIDDDIFDYITEQVESGYELNKRINFDKLNELTSDVFENISIIDKYVIDVMVERVHRSNYYTTYDIKKLVKHITDVFDEENITDSYDKIYSKYKFEESGKIGGKKGSSKKPVKITDKLPKKYGLEVGEIFKSCKDLANKTGNSRTTISMWMRKGWIEKS